MITDIDDLKQQLNSKVPSEAMKAEQEAAVLAEQGNVAAAEMLASAYADGTAAIRADRIKEFKYTRIAADLGSSFSRFWLANLQRQSGDYASALENARRASEMGESNAITLLARMMLAGEGQPAKPLDALQLLSDAVDKNGSTDAAIVLAEASLEGKYIPSNPQHAYDVLHRLASSFGIMRMVAPESHARQLFLKAEAIRMGATPAAGDNYVDLIGKAADAGDGRAAAVRTNMKAEADEQQREAEWKEIARFQAYGGKWKMFPRTGFLVTTDGKSHTSVTGTNGNISTTTSHWQVATFRSVSGQLFTANTPSNTSLVQGRAYAVLYMGPENEDSGVPTAIFDLLDGSAVKANGNIVTAYPKNVTGFAAFLAGFFLLMMGFVGLGLLAGRPLVGVIWLAIVVTLVLKLRKKRRGGLDAAREKAGYFVRKHGAAMA
jgi:TPR repeat protein